MSNNAHDLWRAAIAADLAYVSGFVAGSLRDTLFEKLRARLPIALSDYLTQQNQDSISVLDQYTASITNGFSATVFRLGDVPYFAIRGSNDLADFAIADLFGITAHGAARAQAVEMYRYWRRLTTPLDQPVAYSQAELKYLAGVLLPSLNPLTAFSGAASLVAAVVADRGLGVLPSDAQVVVTGHSLGGHLAQLFYEMFPQSVSHVYTYNAAGVGGAGFELAERLLGLIGRSADVPVAGITNIVAEHGFSLTAGFGRFLGETHRVFNEKSLLPWENHFIDKLTDSLALYDVLGKIDPQLSLASMTAILDAGSNVPAQSLRSVLGRLVDVFRLQDAGIDLPSPGTDRQSYFASLLQLGSVLESAGPSFGVRSLAGMDAQTLLGLARAPDDGVAYRYALAALNPFALLGADYSGANGSGELQLFDPVAGSGAMSERWLADRAGFLATLNFRNAHDLPESQRVAQGSVPVDYASIDAEGNRTVLRGAAGAADAMQIVFGGSANDLVQGNGAGDHLYGGDGSDSLDGGDGDDSLEGGRGGDQLAGGSGDDTLAGGDGDDILVGGAGNDVLEGGPGIDTYRYATGDGADIIRDSDGLGAIVYDGVTLAGGERDAGGSYWDETHTIRYAFAGDPAQAGTLQINGSLVIRDFRNGDLGITLANLEASPAAESSADHSYLEGPFLRGPDGFFSEVDAYGSEANDLFLGTDDTRSQFYGKAGDDVIVASANDSDEAAYLTGGSGDDRITGAESGIDFSSWPLSDIPLLAGGAGRDRIEGSSDPEALFGDLFRVIPYASGSTALSLDALTVSRSNGELIGYWSTNLYAIAGAEYTYESLVDAVKQYLGVTNDTDLAHYYDDYIDAGAGNDYLVGGTGSDVLIGGEGDDTLVADMWAYTYVPKYVLSWTGLEAALPFLGAAGNDTLEGGPGNDILVGNDGDYLDGGPGDDVLIDRNAGVPFLPSGAQDGNVFGDIVMIGGDGDDQIEARAINAYVDGGEGNDTIVVRGSPGSYAFIAAGPGDDDILIESDGASADGGTGSDVYRISTAGRITISDQDANAASVDRVVISSLYRPGIEQFTPQTALIRRDGFDLVIEDDPARITDQALAAEQPLFSLTISNWFAGGDFKIEQIQFGSDEIDFDLAALEEEGFGEGNLDPALIAEEESSQRVFDPAAIEAKIAARELAAASAPQTLQADPEGSTIVGSGGNDSLSGGEGADTLVGGEGNDTLWGGPGEDTLQGGAGDDTYRFDIGGGRDTIADAAAPEAPNSLLFGPGITPESVTLAPGSLVIGPRENGDEIRFASFDFEDPAGAYPIESLRFDDGTVLSYIELLAQGFDVGGTSGDDVVMGTALDDRIDGGAGDDLLLGADGDDVYVFAPGWGNDTLIDWGGEDDTIAFADGIAPGDVRVSIVEGRIVLEAGEDSVAIDWLPEEDLAIERVRFANGDQWDQATLESRAAATPVEPAASTPDSGGQDAASNDSTGGDSSAESGASSTDAAGEEAESSDPADGVSSPEQDTPSTDAGAAGEGSSEVTDSAQESSATDTQSGQSADEASPATGESGSQSASSQDASTGSVPALDQVAPGAADGDDSGDAAAPSANDTQAGDSATQQSDGELPGDTSEQASESAAGEGTAPIEPAPVADATAPPLAEVVQEGAASESNASADAAPVIENQTSNNAGDSAEETPTGNSATVGSLPGESSEATQAAAAPEAEAQESTDSEQQGQAETSSGTEGEAPADAVQTGNEGQVPAASAEQSGEQVSSGASDAQVTGGDVQAGDSSTEGGPVAGTQTAPLDAQSVTSDGTVEAATSGVNGATAADAAAIVPVEASDAPGEAITAQGETATAAGETAASEGESAAAPGEPAPEPEATANAPAETATGSPSEMPADSAQSAEAAQGQAQVEAGNRADSQSGAAAADHAAATVAESSTGNEATTQTPQDGSPGLGSAESETSVTEDPVPSAETVLAQTSDGAASEASASNVPDSGPAMSPANESDESTSGAIAAAETLDPLPAGSQEHSAGDERGPQTSVSDSAPDAELPGADSAAAQTAEDAPGDAPPTAETGESAEPGSAISDASGASAGEGMLAPYEQARAVALQNAQVAGSAQMLRPVEQFSPTAQTALQIETAQRELQRQIDAFFAHITPAPLSTQRWLDDWLPVGGRPYHAERRPARESYETVAGADWSEESNTADLPDGNWISGENAADAETADRYADMHAWLDEHAAVENENFSGIPWNQGLFTLRAGLWLGADEPVGTTLSAASQGLSASMNANLMTLQGLREGFSLLRAG